ncbi:MAG: maltose alpha-D-glucosyltransferase [Candidatus Lambdaproteobacteria bacterium]|nr:maltose alpha-D-glucosyltransferase [Candidatus Lambdaproteobacteria bacterium]
MKTPHRLTDDPLWYKDAIIYELRVRSFFDSNGDGIGDFRGLTEKLDYVQELGVTALWLLPFYPSPLRDDGYDISDYTGIHPDHGTLADFKAFLKAAHRRGLRVITELVLNHSSDQHPWFQRARGARPGSRARNFYVWSDTPSKFNDARIIFQDFEPSNWSWDPTANAYYWHRFFANQPDLNFDNPQVRRTMLKVLDYWFGLGVDGMRLDAVPYLYEREGTNCENLPETHEFLRELRTHVDTKFRNRMLLAEANQWPEDSVAYFGSGDEAHMAFHFPIMPRMFMAIEMEDRFPIIEILRETPPIPERCQWALFLRNHDELTLEMVTDEERDYMYRMYASDPRARVNLGIRRRLAPLLNNSRRRIELMNGLLLAMPGTPVLYYGDEIGMGDNIYLGDRNGVRTPMQWSADRNAGFSAANSQRLYLPVITDAEYHYNAINVETQQQNPMSLLWWMKRLITLRKRYPALGRGDIAFLTPQNAKVLSFVRTYGDQALLVVANLSRFVQYVELDLSRYRGIAPVEVFGKTVFPTIGELPYLLTLGPHNFYWFELPQPRALAPAVATAPAPPQPALAEFEADWPELLEGRGRAVLQELVLAYLSGRRWFGGKARTLRTLQIVEAVPWAYGDHTALVAAIAVAYGEGDAETYLLPLAFVEGERATALRKFHAEFVVAPVRLRSPGGVREGVVCDALIEPAFCLSLLEAIVRRRQFRGDQGAIAAVATSGPRELNLQGALDPRILGGEQTNTSVVFGDRYLLKWLRNIQEGIHPDLEIGQYLTERQTFPHAPEVYGHIEYRRESRPPTTLALLHQFVPNSGDAWRYTLDDLSRYVERVLTRNRGAAQPPVPSQPLVALMEQEPPPEAKALIGGYLESVRLLGQRTAEMHRALADGDDAFKPEPFSTLYQRSLYQGLRGRVSQVLGLLRKRLPLLPPAVKRDAERLLALEPALVARFRAITGSKIEAARTRLHGDYHLGQVLFTGRDFVIVDFEGERARALGERRIKRSPLRDVAGMIRSFDYAAYTVLLGRANGAPAAETDALKPWLLIWQRWVAATYLKSYCASAAGAPFLPPRHDLARLLDVFMIEKALYEVGYELNHRPAWLHVPIEGLLELLRETGR